MKYCEYCGMAIEDGARFCSSCGAPAPIETQTVQTGTVQESTVQTAVPAGTQADAVAVEGGGDYSLVLVSLGSCSEAAAADLLEDTLGYTQTEASELFSLVPAQAAQQLTYQQAQYLAQAMTEYGMEVSVRNASGYISLDESAGSVYDSSGSFLSKVAKVLGVITGYNRMRKFRKLDNRRYYEKPFRPVNYRPQPPVHVRRPSANTVIRPARPDNVHRPAQTPVHHTAGSRPGSLNHQGPSGAGSMGRNAGPGGRDHNPGPGGRDEGRRPGRH